MNDLEKYRFTCNLTLGDIYGQVVVWLAVVFVSLAAALSLMSHPIYSFAAVGLIIVVSLPFLLFTFVTTLFNHIEVAPMTAKEMQKDDQIDKSMTISQKPSAISNPAT